jgi:DNA-binding NtrC family response regulator
MSCDGAAAAAKQRILIVDDEPCLLRLIDAYLSRLGYDVAACSTSEEAWNLFERDPSSYPLILADVTLPGMSGTELVTKMFDLNPQIRVLLSSGYSLDVSKFPPSVHARISFLKKPFLPEMLLESVKELLGEA